MTATDLAWAELGGDPALPSRISTAARPGTLPSHLPVRDMARACVGVCALAAAELGARRAGRPDDVPAVADVPAVRVDDEAVATAFVSERHLLVDGRAPVTFAPLSRYWRTADGWVRTHANYPHHRARLLGALGLPEDKNGSGGGGRGGGGNEAGVTASLAAVLAGRSALEVEETVCAAGGLAVALRTPEEWARHPQGAALAGRPLVERGRLDSAGPRDPAPLSAGPGPLLPAAGLRVLDLTRVIAGPVATRTLALLGADVLRVDPPGLPELAGQHADTGFGKRSATLDLTTDRQVFEDLLATADVVVTGYRPGALDRFGLSAQALAERRPGIVVGQLSAWGAYGPWGGRRGFDSLVQVATGIAVLEGSAEEPGALPAQALDHGTGYLLAAGILRAVTEQLDEGGSRLVRPALARTAMWLLDGQAWGAEARGGKARGTEARGEGAWGEEAAGGFGAAGARGGPGAHDGEAGPGPWLAGTDSALGPLRYALPPVSFAGGPRTWARPPGPWGSDSPRWS